MSWLRRLLGSDPTQPPVVPQGSRTDPVAAIERGDLDTVKVAVTADVSLVLAERPWGTPNGTLLHLASGAGHRDIAEFLLSAGARVDARWCGDGTTPLFLAVTNGHLDIVELLLKSGAQVNLRDSIGETPLAAAIFHSRDAIARLLVARGADVRVRNHFQTEMPEMARLREHPELAEYLQSRKEHGYIRRSLAPAQMAMVMTLREQAGMAVSRVHVHFESGESLFGLNLANDNPPSILLPVEFEQVAIRTVEVPKDQI
ncbi:MAG: ankyrin repeat domain-containing protein [Nitrospira sp.]